MRKCFLSITGQSPLVGKCGTLMTVLGGSMHVFTNFMEFNLRFSHKLLLKLLLLLKDLRGKIV